EVLGGARRRCREVRWIDVVGKRRDERARREDLRDTTAEPLDLGSSGAGVAAEEHVVGHHGVASLFLRKMLSEPFTPQMRLSLPAEISFNSPGVSTQLVAWV